MRSTPRGLVAVTGAVVAVAVVLVATSGRAGTTAGAATPTAPLAVSPAGYDYAWTHLAATYDGSTVRLYVNGEEAASRAAGGRLFTSDGPLRIGGDSLYAEWFAGLVDDVRVYDRPLDAAEIRADAAAPVVSGKTAPGLVAAYAFDAGSGSAVADATGQGHDGAIAGAGWAAGGHAGGALSFDGVDDWVTVPDSGALDFTSGMTLEAWVRPAALGTRWRDVVLKEDAWHLDYGLYASSGSGRPSANVYAGDHYDARGGDVSPNGCAQDDPCLSFDHAYRVAVPGQGVEVAPGAYPLQTIGEDASKTASDDVVFRPAAGGTPTISGLDVYGSHLTFAGLRLEGDWATHAATEDVTFRDLTVHGGIFVSSSSDISVIGGSVGGIQDYKPQFGAWPWGTHSRNILVDGVTFHDVTRSNDGGHVECLLVGGGDGITIRNSRFRNCDVFDLSLGEMNGSGPPTNVTIENNFFGTANGYLALDFNSNTSSLTNVLIRNNSATQQLYLGPVPTLENVRVVGNVAPLAPWTCDTRITYAFNVWNGGTCGPTDIDAPPGFVDAATGDLRLAPGAAAIDRGDPADYPAADIDGNPRPRGAGPDAGAAESAEPSPSGQ
jgi:hypothetical protein